MATFEEQHPRADTGVFTRHLHSIPQITLGSTFDTDRLTASETRKYAEHLAELRPGTDTDNASYYETLTVTHTAQAIVYGRRGAPPQLLWQLHVEGGGAVDVPVFVAKACTAPDLSATAVALKHKRDRAYIASQKSTEERARRSGRVRGEAYGRLRAKEDAAMERFLAADAEYEQALDLEEQPAVAALAQWNSDELITLRGSGYLTRV